MAKKSIGYVKLEWTCPNCNTRNPGPKKTCISCGMAQPDNLKFEQAVEEKIITDEAEAAKAKLGPDKHCFYCGTRNPANAETCSQCGGDLTEAAARKVGQVLGAHQTGPVAQVPCPSCGQPNPANAPKCAHCGAAITQKPEPAVAQAVSASKPVKPPMNPILKIGIIGGFLLLIAVCCYVFTATKDITARIESVEWTRSIAVEGLAPVEHQDWRDEIPLGTLVGTCTQKVHHTQDDPAPNAKEICGTPYTVDQGSGYGEVVQDCKYDVYADWCKFTVDEWQIVDTITVSGNDYIPRWPAAPATTSGRREGAREEKYQVIFNADGEKHIYSPDSLTAFQQFQPNTRWKLEVNKFGGVVSVEPAK